MFLFKFTKRLFDAARISFRKSLEFRSTFQGRFSEASKQSSKLHSNPNILAVSRIINRPTTDPKIPLILRALLSNPSLLKGWGLEIAFGRVTEAVWRVNKPLLVWKTCRMSCSRRVFHSLRTPKILTTFEISKMIFGISITSANGGKHSATHYWSTMRSLSSLLTPFPD